MTKNHLLKIPNSIQSVLLLIQLETRRGQPGSQKKTLANIWILVTSRSNENNKERIVQKKPQEDRTEGGDKSKI